MKWHDEYVRAGELRKAAIRFWDVWTVGVQRGWCREVGKLQKKYRRFVWIGLSVSMGWRKMKAVHDFYRSVVDGTPEADPAAFERDLAMEEKEPGA